MNYIYDIVLNFQPNYYNFFEWNKTDKLKNISKIPLYHIRDKDILILKNNEVCVAKDFIGILNQDCLTKKLICLVSNGKIALALMFSNAGNLIKRSSLIFEEEEEVINVAKYLPITKIEYIKNIPVNNHNKLRIEREKKEKIINYIKETNNSLILKYLYYEYYETEKEDVILIKKSLLEELSKEWNIKHNKLYKFINMLQKTK